MADFGKQQDFRKGSILRKLHEDPTYLSFFLAFETSDREGSPLLSGAAKDYLTKVIRTDEGEKYAKHLENFQKVLMKINREMPWFWQSLAGIDTAMTFNQMQEPWWGAEKPKLEIECLEENVELTAIGLMDLYKRACYDFTRWVEVIPHNLRHFKMYVFVSEVRQFQQDTDAANLGFYDDPENANNSGNGGAIKKINQDFSLAAKPFIQLEFSHCEFDIDSIAPMFADLSKNPEMKKPKVAIKWGSVHQLNQKLGNNLVVEEDNSPFKEINTSDQDRNPFDPSNARRTISSGDGAGRGDFSLPGDPTFKSVLKDRTLGKVTDSINDAVAGVTNRFNNAKDSLSLKNNSDIGNVYGKPGGLAAGLLDKAEDAILSKLLLGNVHGISGGSLLDAIAAGSINGIANQLGSLFGGANNAGGGGIQENIHPNGVDSSPDGMLNYRIHEPGVDSTPDGNLNDNVHE